MMFFRLAVIVPLSLHSMTNGICFGGRHSSFDTRAISRWSIPPRKRWSIPFFGWSLPVPHLKNLFDYLSAAAWIGQRERERERQSSFVFLAARVPANHGVLVTSGCKGNRCRLPGHFRCHCDFSWETRGWVLWIRVQSDFTTFLTKSFQFSCDLFWSRCHCHRPCSDPHQPPNCWVEMT